MGYKVLIIEDDLTYKPLWTEMLNNNIHIKDIANKFGVQYHNIYNIKRGKTRSYV